MNGAGSISGKTTVVGLIGWPVGHSVSPAMHNAAFAACGLDWVYVPLPVARPEAVGPAVAGLAALGLRGANVTVPHKQDVMPHLHRLTAAALAIGAVNTILVEPEGVLVGDNTDAAGFIADLRAHGVEPAGRRVLLLGAGGSARAAGYGLAEAGAAAITIANRTPGRGEELAAALARLFPGCPVAAVLLPAALPDIGPQADLVVNTTSLGMHPHPEGLPWLPELPFHPGQVVYDLVYNPVETRLLQQARRDGAQPIGGLGMLIRQGAAAFTLWTHRAAPVEVMAAAARRMFGLQSETR